MTECKICHQSWRPPHDIIFKDGMCVICYAITNRDKNDEEQNTMERWI